MPNIPIQPKIIVHLRRPLSHDYDNYRVTSNLAAVRDFIKEGRADSNCNEIHVHLRNKGGRRIYRRHHWNPKRQRSYWRLVNPFPIRFKPLGD